MKSLSAIVYEPAARSTTAPVHAPFAACRTAPVTRLPAAAVMSYVKQSPDTCGKRPSAFGIRETPFSSICLSWGPVTVALTAKLPNGRTEITCPIVIGNGGGVDGGQNPAPPPAAGQVRSARRPPEFVIAKSVPESARRASATTLPIRDSHV